MEGSSKKGKGLMDIDNSAMIAVWGIREINGNGKNIIKILKNKPLGVLKL